MLDGLFRMGVRLLPPGYDARDRAEMVETYVARTSESDGGSSRRTRLSDCGDLAVTVLRAWLPGPDLDSARVDLRDAFRSLTRSPGTSVLAVGSLAIGLAATTSMFSALDVWLLRPLPLPHADRLVAVSMANRSTGWMNNAFTVRDYAEWAGESRTVDLMAYASGSYNFVADGRASRVQALRVSANAPGVLGIEPIDGRAFTPDEGRSGGPPVVLLAHRFWSDALGADPDVIGGDVALDGVSYTVIGVLPPGQGIPGSRADVWTPLRIAGDEPRTGHFLRGIGLMHEGVDVGAVQSELDAVAAATAERDPEQIFSGAWVRPLRESLYDGGYRQGGLFLGGTALLVLLIACANVANLLLARGLARTHELAVRSSLGASRGRIVRQLLVESTVIATAGAALGLLGAWVGIDLLLTHALPAEYVTGWDQIGLDRRVTFAAGVLTVASTLVFGLVPAIRISRVDPGPGLTGSDRSGASPSQGRLARGLVVGEIALTMTLVALSGLMVRSFVALRSVDMEMRTDDALLFRLLVPEGSRATMAGVRAFHAELAERLEANAGVHGLATSSGNPMGGWSTVLYSTDDAPTEEDGLRSAEHRRVGNDYLDVMELRMVAGRWFDDEVDRPASEPVAVVSRALAAQWWSQPAEALGEDIRYGDDRRVVVGVVDPGRIRGPADPPPPAILVPYAQDPTRATFHVLSHALDDRRAVEAVRRVVAEIDPGLAVYDVQTIEDAHFEALGPQGSALRILGTLGAFGLLLTLVGVYGVMAHWVGRRMREMGIRLALGADRASVLRLVLLGNLKLCALGVAIGLALSAIAGQGLSFVVVGVGPRDPATLVSVSLLLSLAVMLASLVPARRAATTDPARTLREE